MHHTRSAFSAPDTFTFSRFGRVAVYPATGPQAAVVLLFSGDGGMEPRIDAMAKLFASWGASVAVVNIQLYRKGYNPPHSNCAYLAADVEALSKNVQKRLGLSEYNPPILVGYSSGATLVYALLAEAPVGTFGGAISLGFCQDLSFPRPLCKNGKLAFTPTRAVPAKNPLGIVPNSYNMTASNLQGEPWYILRGEGDQECTLAEVKNVSDAIPSANLVLLPKVGHGFASIDNWKGEGKKAYDTLVAKIAINAGVKPLADLPVIELPAAGAATTPTLAIMFSGDGGWAGIDRDFAATLNEKGISVVGLDTLRYFWTARTADESMLGLERILEHYATAWHPSKIILMGYSFGADLLVPLVSHLPKEDRQQISLVALVAPGLTVDYEMHVSYWLGQSSTHDAISLIKEVPGLRDVHSLCIDSKDDSNESLCTAAPSAFSHEFELPGGHHFNGNYKKIIDLIVQNISS